MLFSVGQRSSPARPLSDLKPKEKFVFFLLTSGPLNPLRLMGEEIGGGAVCNAQMDLLFAQKPGVPLPGKCLQGWQRPHLGHADGQV